MPIRRRLIDDLNPARPRAMIAQHEVAQRKTVATRHRKRDYAGAALVAARGEGDRFVAAIAAVELHVALHDAGVIRAQDGGGVDAGCGGSESLCLWLVQSCWIDGGG
jgi:hypothetical protein